MRASGDKGAIRDRRAVITRITWSWSGPKPLPTRTLSMIASRGRGGQRSTDGQKETPSREGGRYVPLHLSSRPLPRAHTRTQSACARSYTPVDRMETYTGAGIGGCFSVWRGGF